MKTIFEFISKLGIAVLDWWEDTKNERNRRRFLRELEKFSENASINDLADVRNEWLLRVREKRRNANKQ